MASKTFAELKSDIAKAIDTRLKLVPIVGEKELILIDGFFVQPLMQEISGNIILGGPAVPMVAVLGKTSGRMYYYALKELLPESIA